MDNQQPNFFDQLKKYPESIHINCMRKKPMKNQLAQANEITLKSTLKRVKNARNNYKNELAFSKMFLKFQKEQKFNKFSIISEKEYHSIVKILQVQLEKLLYKREIQQNDFNLLKKLIALETQQTIYTTGSASVSLALKINGLNDD